ncbi:hypothetical protein DFH09DRAFT_1080457 [Mycena vulgaris]|nr:hypothetical protein DFH09DRAFT_1080457 [Mycena vulgaris]
MQLLLALSALLVVPVLAATVRSSPDKRITLDIANAPVAPDGFTRIGILANGTFPGPVITATKGQKLIVRVNNKLASRGFRWVLDRNPNVFNEGSPFVTFVKFITTLYLPDFIPLEHAIFVQIFLTPMVYVVLICFSSASNMRTGSGVRSSSMIWTVADWWHNTSTSGLISYNLTQVIHLPVPVSRSSAKTSSAAPRASRGAESHGKEPNKSISQTIWFRVTAAIFTSCHVDANGIFSVR